MAATRHLSKVLTACPRYPRQLLLRNNVVPFSQSRLQSSLQDNINKVNHATANMSAANAGTISDVIKHDHAELKEYYDNILSAKDSDSKIRWQNQFTWELARHSIGEELVVYPAMEQHMGDEGKSLAQKDRESHNEVRFRD